MAKIWRDVARILVMAFLAECIQRLWQKLQARRSLVRNRIRWEARVEMGVLQACLLTAVNVGSCGRIEKRTLFMKRLTDVFSNKHVLSLITAAAQKTTPENPFVVQHMQLQDRWHILNLVQNHVSSLFGPYHLFSEQVSNYESSWFVFTLLGTRTSASGRFFITPRRTVAASEDVGFKRIRVILVHEQELRSICCGDIAPTEFFSKRHEARWLIMKHFGEVFENQLTCVVKPTGPMDIRVQSWGPNLCGTMKRVPTQVDDSQQMYYNNFLRTHIPIPLVRESKMCGRTASD
eukprot:NODE_12988_length_1192_cov_5.153991.p1 GENE.NODE_12988_length_1192_cov_5.153991~~NODE_12988_length_1192_cov_5.153991.p1  ORF type:complete len:291 (-),score=47.00 NODE_12988_length_1192_cov_5.153991:196-1068(-)